MNKINNCAPSDRNDTDWELHSLATDKSFPEEFSRRNKVPSVSNQGVVGSCVGQSLKNVFSDSEQCKDLDLSAMWIYKRAKLYDYWGGEDYEGTSISGACEALRRDGACLESFYPYNATTEEVSPLNGASEDANKRKIKGYFNIRIAEVEKVKALIMRESMAFSMNIHAKFYEANSTGIVPSEGYTESKFNGGHAMALTGWKTIDGVLHWELMNSWGENWGDGGFVYVPHEICNGSATSRCYYLVTADDDDGQLSFGRRKKDRRALPIKFIHGFLNSILKLFGKKPKFGPEAKKY